MHSFPSSFPTGECWLMDEWSHTEIWGYWRGGRGVDMGWGRAYLDRNFERGERILIKFWSSSLFLSLAFGVTNKWFCPIKPVLILFFSGSLQLYTSFFFMDPFSCTPVSFFCGSLQLYTSFFFLWIPLAVHQFLFLWIPSAVQKFLF